MIRIPEEDEVVKAVGKLEAGELSNPKIKLPILSATADGNKLTVTLLFDRPISEIKNEPTGGGNESVVFVSGNTEHMFWCECIPITIEAALYALSHLMKKAK